MRETINMKLENLKLSTACRWLEWLEYNACDLRQMCRLECPDESEVKGRGSETHS